MVNVSVIVPVYNVEAYLCQCLDSLVGQSMSGIEIILINDGSTDGSMNILQKYKNRYDNIVILDQPNQGQSAARNNGLKHATGKYITFVDSDDFVDRDMLGKLFDAAERNDCPLVISDSVLYWPDRTSAFNSLGKVKDGFVYDADGLYRILLGGLLQTVVWGRLYRRDIWERNSLSFPVGQIYEDILLTFQIVRCYGMGLFIKEPLYKYRMREGSSVATTSPEKIQNLLGAIADVNKFVAAELTGSASWHKYVMCFNIQYGMYAQQLNSFLPDRLDMKSEIDRNIDMNPGLFKVLFSSVVSPRIKLKYFCYKLGMLYKKKK